MYFMALLKKKIPIILFAGSGVKQPCGFNKRLGDGKYSGLAFSSDVTSFGFLCVQSRFLSAAR